MMNSPFLVYNSSLVYLFMFLLLAYHIINHIIIGVLSSNGQVWLEQRRFSLATLRDLGLGKSGMEALTVDEARCKA